MKTILGSRGQHYLARVGTFFIALALIAGMAGCEPTQYELYIAMNAGGLVTTPGHGIFIYVQGTVVNLVATPNPGYDFAGWSGDVGTIADVHAAITTITMNGDYHLSPNFAFEPQWIHMISAGYFHTVGLKSDGTVVAVGRNDSSQCNVGNWTDIIQVSAGYSHTVGLKADGTAVAAGSPGCQYGPPCDFSNWAGITQVAAGGGYTVGLCSNRSVVNTVWWDPTWNLEMSGWTGITQIAAGTWHTVGLEVGGTVVAAGDNLLGSCDVGNWTGITQVAAGSYHTVGLTFNRTVVAVGSDGSGQCNVGGWTDIIQVAAGLAHTVGLCSNGTVVAVGALEYGACDVGNWADIIQVAAGSYHTVGLCSNGTVVAVGGEGPEIGYGQCNVCDWDLTPDVTAPSNVSVMINNGAASTSSPTVTLSITATDNVGVTGYYISETSTTPSGTAPDWTSVTSTMSYSANVPFILSNSDGTKTIYVWFKDDVGNVSAPATASITVAGTVSMITPYPCINETDYWCHQPFCSTDGCPLGFEHNGLDFSTTGDLKPFQAVCSGVVGRVELWQPIANWQVNVQIIFNSIYSVEYAFEPMSTVQSDGRTQLENIVVAENQTVSQGAIIGYLYSAPNPDAHVHFMLGKNWVSICPEPYFTQEARDSVLRVLHKDRPEWWDMCY